jgi:hypothetical protein
MEDLLYFNGINAANGTYLLPPTSPTLFAKGLEGQELDPKDLAELKTWLFEKNKEDYGLKEGDPNDLAKSGWGVIFPANVDPCIRQALKELLDWRQEQAGAQFAHYYREFSRTDGYQPGDTKLGWLARQNMGPGPADPNHVPYYLLLVGDPQTIPYRFQTQLDVQYAVGRIDFDKIEDYARYAHSVVEAEKRQIALARTVTFFGVNNPDDPPTNLSATELVQPLAASTAHDHPDWLVRSIPPEQTTKSSLARLVGGEETPALLFTASHGLGFPNGHKLQMPRQGALLTQDWPGPLQYQQEIPEDFYFSAEDVGDEAHVFGMLAFLFACYGAGTPQMEEFAHAAFKDAQSQIAPQAFLAALPKRLLSHPRGSALAVVGHVDRAWGYSFFWGSAKRQLAVFESALSLLLKGYPIGAAIDPFNVRYAELSEELNRMLEDIQFGKRYEARELAGMWTANNDARNYVVIGDPAVRMMAALPGAVTAQRPEATPLTLTETPSTPDRTSDGLSTAVTAGDVIPPLQTLGRLFSVVRDRGYPIPPLDSIVIGRRDPTTANYPDIDLSDEAQFSISVSRRHARITVVEKQIFIEDLNSTNFTRLNGTKLEPGQRHLLKNGDELRLGEVILIYIAY